MVFLKIYCLFIFLVCQSLRAKMRIEGIIVADKTAYSLSLLLSFIDSGDERGGN